MSFRGKLSILMVSAAIALYAVIGGILSPWARAQQPINDAGAQIRIFESVLQHIQNDYVDEPNLEKVRFGALRGLVGGLDPYSSYLTAQQVTEFNASKTTNKVGIGAEFSEVSLYLYVVSVVKGSTAEKAGLKAGDVIEYIENKEVSFLNVQDFNLANPAGSPLVNQSADQIDPIAALPYHDCPLSSIVWGSFPIPIDWKNHTHSGILA